MKKITIIDVANHAGVSIATVSRAMHSPHKLRPATLQRVLSVIEDKGYVYNSTAGDFSRKQSTVIGLLVHSNTTKVTTSIKAIQQLAANEGYSLLLSMSNFDPDIEKNHILTLQQRNVAGIIVIGHMKSNMPLLEHVERKGIPCVYLWDTHPGTNKNYIGIDNQEAFFNMTNSLIKSGYKRIGFICGTKSGVERIRKRYQGYIKALEHNNINLEEELLIPATSSFANGKKAMEELLSLQNKPDCVFCASDVLALGAISAVHEANLNIPKDIAVVGFDNSDHSAYTHPPLTTVEVPGQEIGFLAFKSLMSIINKEEKLPIQITLPTKIITRKSSIDLIE